MLRGKNTGRNIIGNVCIVSNCRHRYGHLKADLTLPDKVRYFGFPTDPKLRKLWINKCAQPGNWNPDVSKVCSIHFRDEDFEKDELFDELCLLCRRVLKNNVVPTLNLGHHSADVKLPLKIRRKEAFLDLDVPDETVPEEEEAEVSNDGDGAEGSHTQQEEEEKEAARVARKNKLIKQFSELCRLCAKPKSGNEDLIPILGDMGKQLQIEEKLIYLPIEFSAREDRLPMQTCSRCVIELHVCHELIMKCAIADAKHRELLYLEDDQMDSPVSFVEDSSETYVEDSSSGSLVEESSSGSLVEESSSDILLPDPGPVSPCWNYTFKAPPPVPVDSVHIFTETSEQESDIEIPTLNSSPIDPEPPEHFRLKKCTIDSCNFSTSSLKCFIIHTKNSHNKKICIECEQIFDSNEKLVNHVLLQHSESTASEDSSLKVNKSDNIQQNYVKYQHSLSETFKNFGLRDNEAAENSPQDYLRKLYSVLEASEVSDMQANDATNRQQNGSKNKVSVLAPPKIIGLEANKATNTQHNEVHIPSSVLESSNICNTRVSESNITDQGQHSLLVSSPVFSDLTQHSDIAFKIFEQSPHSDAETSEIFNVNVSEATSAQQNKYSVLETSIMTSPVVNDTNNTRQNQHSVLLVPEFANLHFEVAKNTHQNYLTNLHSILLASKDSDLKCNEPQNIQQNFVLEASEITSLQVNEAITSQQNQFQKQLFAPLASENTGLGVCEANESQQTQHSVLIANEIPNNSVIEAINKQTLVNKKRVRNQHPALLASEVNGAKLDNQLSSLISSSKFSDLNKNTKTSSAVLDLAQYSDAVPSEGSDRKLDGDRNTQQKQHTERDGSNITDLEVNLVNITQKNQHSVLIPSNVSNFRANEAENVQNNKVHKENSNKKLCEVADLRIDARILQKNQVQIEHSSMLSTPEFPELTKHSKITSKVFDRTQDSDTDISEDSSLKLDGTTNVQRYQHSVMEVSEIIDLVVNVATNSQQNRQLVSAARDVSALQENEEITNTRQHGSSKPNSALVTSKVSVLRVNKSISKQKNMDQLDNSLKKILKNVNLKISDARNPQNNQIQTQHSRVLSSTDFSDLTQNSEIPSEVFAQAQHSDTLASEDTVSKLDRKTNTRQNQHTRTDGCKITGDVANRTSNSQQNQKSIASEVPTLKDSEAASSRQDYFSRLHSVLQASEVSDDRFIEAENSQQNQVQIDDLVIEICEEADVSIRDTKNSQGNKVPIQSCRLLSSPEFSDLTQHSEIPSEVFAQAQHSDTLASEDSVANLNEDTNTRRNQHTEMEGFKITGLEANGTSNTQRNQNSLASEVPALKDSEAARSRQDYFSRLHSVLQAFKVSDVRIIEAENSQQNQSQIDDPVMEICEEADVSIRDTKNLQGNKVPIQSCRLLSSPEFSDLTQHSEIPSEVFAQAQHSDTLASEDSVANLNEDTNTRRNQHTEMEGFIITGLEANGTSNTQQNQNSLASEVPALKDSEAAKSRQDYFSRLHSVLRASEVSDVRFIEAINIQQNRVQIDDSVLEIREEADVSISDTKNLQGNKVPIQSCRLLSSPEFSDLTQHSEIPSEVFAQAQHSDTVLSEDSVSNLGGDTNTRRNQHNSTETSKITGLVVIATSNTQHNQNSVSVTSEVPINNDVARSQQDYFSRLHSVLRASEVSDVRLIEAENSQQNQVQIDDSVMEVCEEAEVSIRDTKASQEYKVPIQSCRLLSSPEFSDVTQHSEIPSEVFAQAQHSDTLASEDSAPSLNKDTNTRRNQHTKMGGFKIIGLVANGTSNTQQSQSSVASEVPALKDNEAANSQQDYLSRLHSVLRASEVSDVRFIETKIIQQNQVPIDDSVMEVCEKADVSNNGTKNSQENKVPIQSCRVLSSPEFSDLTQNSEILSEVFAQAQHSVTSASEDSVSNLDEGTNIRRNQHTISEESKITGLVVIATSNTQLNQNSVSVASEVPINNEVTSSQQDYFSRLHSVLRASEISDVRFNETKNNEQNVSENESSVKETLEFAELKVFKSKNTQQNQVPYFKTVESENVGTRVIQTKNSENQIKNRKVKKKEEFRCANCSQTGFINKRDYKRHMAQHETNCPICDKRFSSKNNAKKHLRSVHLTNLEFECGDCQKVLKNKSALHSHILMKHLLEWIYSCNICSYVSGDLKEMYLHINEKHSKQKKRAALLFSRTSKYKCKICKNMYANQFCLKKHRSKCSKKTINRRVLRHIQNFKKVEKCHLCLEIFSGRGALSRHLRDDHYVNDGSDIYKIGTEKNGAYECNACKKILANRDSLKVHHRYIHTKERIHKCSQCIKSFYLKTELESHENKEHWNKTPYHCNICPKKFHGSHLLSRHMRSHSQQYTCEFCSKSFAYAEKLRRHKLTHTGDKPHVCKICNQGFIEKNCMERHQLAHITEKKFKCSECDFDGNTFQDVVTHVKNVHSFSGDVVVIRQNITVSLT